MQIKTTTSTPKFIKIYISISLLLETESIKEQKVSYAITKFVTQFPKLCSGETVYIS